MDVLVLGNGFDLSHNLPTTYLCFLKVTEYLSKQTLKKELTIGEIFNSVKDECPQIKNSYEAYKSVYDVYKLDFDKLSKLCKQCEENEWWRYFVSVFNKDVGWIDFEKEIAIVVDQIDQFILKNAKPDRTFFLRGYNTVVAAAFPFFIIRTIISSYEVPHDTNENIHIYNCAYRYRPEYIVNNNNQKDTVDRNKIANDLFDKLIEFSKVLETYFELFVDNTIEQLMDKGLIKTNQKYKEFKHIITYNYTNTFEKIYLKETAHIHGTLGKSIVLGINPDNNDEVNGDITFISFKKYYQRVILGTDLEYLNKLTEMKKLFNHNQKVKLSVVGHSLDITDKDSLKELFEASNEIIIYFHNENYIPVFVRNLIRIFGKEKFDELRNDRQLRFISLHDLPSPIPSAKIIPRPF